LHFVFFDYSKLKAQKPSPPPASLDMTSSESTVVELVRLWSMTGPNIDRAPAPQKTGDPNRVALIVMNVQQDFFADGPVAIAGANAEYVEKLNKLHDSRVSFHTTPPNKHSQS
jgi:hypothetical protein